MENNIEKKTRNNNDRNSPLFIGGLVECIFPGIGAVTLISASTINTYLYGNAWDKKQGFKTNPENMFLYAMKNSAKILVGATAVSAIRYFF